MKATKVRVKFVVDKLGEVTALFPDVNEGVNGYGDVFMCYAHVGQHCTYSPEWAKKCRKAKPAEYADLLQELQSIGYDVEILK